MLKRLKFAVASAIFLLPLAYSHSALSRSPSYQQAVWMCGNGNLQACEVMYAYEMARSGVAVAAQRVRPRSNSASDPTARCRGRAQIEDRGPPTQNGGS
jgi:hypothetical protein